jgi:hypothetical protein
LKKDSAGLLGVACMHIRAPFGASSAAVSRMKAVGAALPIHAYFTPPAIRPQKKTVIKLAQADFGIRLNKVR